MNNTVTHIERNETPRAEQLTLLSVPKGADRTKSSVHARFRLSETTRMRGLSHVAEIRRQLAESQARSDAAKVTALPPRGTHAA